MQEIALFSGKIYTTGTNFTAGRDGRDKSQLCRWPIIQIIVKTSLIRALFDIYFLGSSFKFEQGHLVDGEGGCVNVGHLPHVVPRLLAILHLVCAGHDDNQVEYSKKMFLED